MHVQLKTMSCHGLNLPITFAFPLKKYQYTIKYKPDWWKLKFEAAQRLKILFCKFKQNHLLLAYMKLPLTVVEAGSHLLRESYPQENSGVVVSSFMTHATNPSLFRPAPCSLRRELRGINRRIRINTRNMSGAPTRQTCKVRKQSNKQTWPRW